MYPVSDDPGHLRCRTKVEKKDKIARNDSSCDPKRPTPPYLKEKTKARNSLNTFLI